MRYAEEGKPYNFSVPVTKNLYVTYYIDKDKRDVYECTRDQGCTPIPGETQNLHIESNVKQSDVALHFNMSLYVVTRNDSGSIWTVRGKVDKVPLGVPEKFEDLVSCSLQVYGQPRPPEITVDQTSCDYNKSIVINVTLTYIVDVNGILFSMLQKNCKGDTFEYLCMISIKNYTCNYTEECICVRKAHDVFEVKLKRFVEPSSYVLKTELRNRHITNTFYENICTQSCSNITKSVGLDGKLEANNSKSTYILIGSTIGGGMVLIGVIVVAVLVKLKGKAKCNSVNTAATCSNKSTTPTDSSPSYIDVVEDYEIHENPYDEIVDSSGESNSDRNTRHSYIEVHYNYENINTYDRVDTFTDERNVYLQTFYIENITTVGSVDVAATTHV